MNRQLALPGMPTRRRGCSRACWRRGWNYAHCGRCHQTFASLADFDAHRLDGHCLDPPVRPPPATPQPLEPPAGTCGHPQPRTDDHSALEAST